MAHLVRKKTSKHIQFATFWKSRDSW